MYELRIFSDSTSGSSCLKANYCQPGVKFRAAFLFLFFRSIWFSQVIVGHTYVRLYRLLEFTEICFCKHSELNSNLKLKSQPCFEQPVQRFLCLEAKAVFLLFPVVKFVSHVVTSAWCKPQRIHCCTWLPCLRFSEALDNIVEPRYNGGANGLVNFLYNNIKDVFHIFYY